MIAPFLWLGNSYRAAQIPFVLLAALLGPVTYALSLKLFALAHMHPPLNRLVSQALRSSTSKSNR